jgi:hypothetical protein
MLLISGKAKVIMGKAIGCVLMHGLLKVVLCAVVFLPVVIVASTVEINGRFLWLCV